MSRIGKMPVVIPAGVSVELKDGNTLSVKGPKGTLERTLPQEMTIEVKEGEIVTIIGANGAGKSTTLKSIAGLVGKKKNSEIISSSIRQT